MGYAIGITMMIVGFGLMILGASREAEVALFGMAFQPHIAKGVGLIGMIIGALGLLAAYGNTLPDRRAERRA